MWEQSLDVFNFIFSSDKAKCERPHSDVARNLCLPEFFRLWKGVLGRLWPATSLSPGPFLVGAVTGHLARFLSIVWQVVA